MRLMSVIGKLQWPSRHLTIRRFIIFGLLIYTFNLPTSIHLYKKARNRLHR